MSHYFKKKIKRKGEEDNKSNCCPSVNMLYPYGGGTPTDRPLTHQTRGKLNCCMHFLAENWTSPDLDMSQSMSGL